MCVRSGQGGVRYEVRGWAHFTRFTGSTMHCKECTEEGHRGRTPKAEGNQCTRRALGEFIKV